MLKRYAIIIFVNLFITAEIFASSVDVKNLCPHTDQKQFSPSEIARMLGWVRSSHDNSLCGGCYVDSANIASIPNPKAMREMPMNITASKQASLAQHGTSTVMGDVTLVQPGREIKADCVTFFRDDKTHKITNGLLVGHVNYHEYGKLIVAQQSNLDFVNELYTLNNGFYRLLGKTPSGITNVWGRAKHAIRDAAGLLKMRKATYSACPPDAVSWYLWSDRLTLNRNTGRGEAVNALVFFKKVPIFYTPYFSFSIDKQRKSGFLYPEMMYFQDSGVGLSLPYYFNLAPNYDATFTPKFFTKRGFLLEGLFNYLLPSSSGSVDINYIPYDRAFVNFRDGASSYPAGHARTVLEDSSAGRGYLELHNDLRLNEHWKGVVNINYATDDYFLKDFSSATTSINKDQLFNQAGVNYADDIWHFSTSVQGFQTLHPITSAGNSDVVDQYRRVPQLNFGADFPDGLGGLNYQFDSEAVNFTHLNNFNDSKPVVAGGRFSVGSSASLPLHWLGAYIIPKIRLQATGYSVHDRGALVGPHNNTRFLPQVSVDSGVIFSRDINFFQQKFAQTLEPRLLYLFVPTKNQENTPVFDTSLPGLDFNQLFRTNRFSGIDRIGDANQIAAGVTTRFLDDFGQEKLNAGIGQIVVFHKHQVVIPNGVDPLINETLSPIMGQLQYFIAPKINAKIDTAWDPNYHRFNTAGINFQYNDNAEKVVNFWYSYSLRGDSSAQNKNADLSRVGFSLGWRLWQHWNVLGNLEYNVSYKRAQNYIYGLEYDSCCWAMRLVQSRTFIGIGSNNKNKYEARVYLQFFLKGLGDWGKGNLAGNISGYNDKRAIGL